MMLRRCTQFIPTCSRGLQTSVLESLAPAPGAHNNSKRLGRGASSGKGKTAGRGHKGQKARQGGGTPRGFEGGQTPIHRLFPKRGFNNFEHEELSPINLDRIQQWIDLGRLDPSQPITIKALADSRALHGVKDGVKLLARGAGYFRTPVTVDVTKASASAIKRVEALGGKVTCTYRNALALRAHLKPHVFSILPKSAMPIKRKDIEYYTSHEKRGYLAGVLTPPENPVERIRRERAAAAATTAGAAGGATSAATASPVVTTAKA
ncbi:YmL10 [Savitreella phatthalungensis]